MAQSPWNFLFQLLWLLHDGKELINKKLSNSRGQAHINACSRYFNVSSWLNQSKSELGRWHSEKKSQSHSCAGCYHKEWITVTSYLIYSNLKWTKKIIWFFELCWQCKLATIKRFESLYSGQFILSTRLIKPNYLVILAPTQHHSFFRNLPPLFEQKRVAKMNIMCILIRKIGKTSFAFTLSKLIYIQLYLCDLIFKTSFLWKNCQ